MTWLHLNKKSTRVPHYDASHFPVATNLTMEDIMIFGVDMSRAPPHLRALYENKLKEVTAKRNAEISAHRRAIRVENKRKGAELFDEKVRRLQMSEEDFDADLYVSPEAESLPDSEADLLSDDFLDLEAELEAIPMPPLPKPSMKPKYDALPDLEDDLPSLPRPATRPKCDALPNLDEPKFLRDVLEVLPEATGNDACMYAFKTALQDGSPDTAAFIAIVMNDIKRNEKRYVAKYGQKWVEFRSQCITSARNDIAKCIAEGGHLAVALRKLAPFEQYIRLRFGRIGNFGFEDLVLAAVVKMKNLVILNSEYEPMDTFDVNTFGFLEPSSLYDEHTVYLMWENGNLKPMIVVA